MREGPANSWITVEMWIIVHPCASLCREQKLSQTTVRRLGRQVKVCLAADCLLHTKNTASNIQACLAAGDFSEAWHYLRGWYCLAEDQAPIACSEMLARQTAEWLELYTAVPPLGWSPPINATPTPVPNRHLTDLEIKEVVVKLRNCCAVGAMGMKAEHMKGLLRNIKREEKVDGKKGAGSHWRLFVSLIQAVWERGTIPT